MLMTRVLVTKYARQAGPLNAETLQQPEKRSKRAKKLISDEVGLRFQKTSTRN
jgi:hypothetical protein